MQRGCANWKGNAESLMRTKLKNVDRISSRATTDFLPAVEKFI